MINLKKKMKRNEKRFFKREWLIRHGDLRQGYEMSERRVSVVYEVKGLCSRDWWLCL